MLVNLYLRARSNGNVILYLTARSSDVILFLRERSSEVILYLRSSRKVILCQRAKSSGKVILCQRGRSNGRSFYVRARSSGKVILCTVIIWIYFHQIQLRLPSVCWHLLGDVMSSDYHPSEPKTKRLNDDVTPVNVVCMFCRSRCITPR